MQAFLDALAAIFAAILGRRPATPAAIPSAVLAPADGPAAFRQRIAAIAGRVSKMRPAFVVAIADLETGAGAGKAYKSSNNAFSIHAVGGPNQFWDGRAHNAKGMPEFGPESLRVYNTLEDSVRDFDRLMQTPRYRQAYALAVAGDPRYFSAMHQAGYAVDPRYPEKALARYAALGGNYA